MKALEDADPFRDFLNNLPDGKKAKGTAFEEFCVRYLPMQPELGIVKAWLWNDWKHRWGADLGIDFVAQDSTGGYWAGQCKALTEDALVSKREIDSFVNESGALIPGLSVPFKRRIVITTGNGLGRNAKAALERRTDAPTLVITRSSLEHWKIDSDSLVRDQPKKKPKPHQLAAISKVKEHLQNHNKGQLIMACGTGKTLTALWLYEELNSDFCVVAVPSLSLMEQTLHVWFAEASRKFKAISICSDDSVAPSSDELVSSVIDLELPVTTNVEDLKKEMKSDLPKVVFTTYASMPVLVKLLDSIGKHPDLTIADEAHRTVGQMGRLSSLIHDSSVYQSDRFIFLTATPRVVNTEKLNAQGDVEVLSMDSEKDFGPVVHNLTFFDAIHKEKLLVDYEIHNLIIHDDELFQNLAIDAKLKETDRIERQSIFDTVIPDVIVKFVVENKLGNTITYHSRRSRAESFKDAINAMDIQNVEAYFVSGEMSARQRSRILDKFKEKDVRHTIISNARCLTEGIDVPNLDSVAFVDPRYSVTDIVQAVGRVLRTSPGKIKGHVLVPMIVNSSGEYSRESYMGIMRVIRALESHDPSLTDEIQAMSRAVGSGLEPAGLTKLRIENFSGLPQDFLEKIRTNLLQETLDVFSVGLGNLIQFIKHHGREPNRNEEFLGRFPEGWRSKQRSYYNAGLLSERRIVQIEEAFRQEFGDNYWSWDPQLANDLEMANHLEEFVLGKLDGGTYYPFIRIHRKTGKSICSHGLDIGKWALTLGVRARTTGLHEQLKKRIEKIPNFTVNDSNVETFWWARDRYVEYRTKHGFSPDGDYRTDTYGTKAIRGYPLGDTVANWRATRHRKNGSMPQWKVEALDEIGFEWKVPRGNFRNTKRLNNQDVDVRIKEVSQILNRLGRRPRAGEISFKSAPDTDVAHWINACVSRDLRLTENQSKALQKLGIMPKKSKR